MNKLLTLGVASLAVTGIVGTTYLSASALNGAGNGPGPQASTQQRDGTGYGLGRQASLESRAQVLGMTTDELQKALQTKTMSQIAVEKGMTQDEFQTKMEAAAKARWEARGLSSEEIAKRVAEREARQAANEADHEFGSGAGNHQGRHGWNQ